MREYKLDPNSSFYENIVKVFEMKISEEKFKFEYINPNMMMEILDVIDTYGENAGFETDEKIHDWVREMYGA
jgi:hypothetical protein